MKHFECSKCKRVEKNPSNKGGPEHWLKVTVRASSHRKEERPILFHIAAALFCPSCISFNALVYQGPEIKNRMVQAITGGAA